MTRINDIQPLHLFRMSFMKRLNKLTRPGNHVALSSRIEMSRPTQHSRTQVITHAPTNVRHSPKCEQKRTTCNFAPYFTHTTPVLSLRRSIQPERDNDSDGTKGSNELY